LKVLFLYPNVGTELRIPLAISILIASLRKARHEVQLFDTTFYGEFHTDNEVMVKMGTHKGTNLNALVGETKRIDVKDALTDVISDFNPDIICVSLVERNFHTAKELLSDVDVPVLAGGIMPTIATDYVLKQYWVDMVCVGEGENALVDYLETLNPLTPNIWSEKLHNPLRPLIDLDDVPEQDWTDFDERHLLKPFMGKVYRGGAFEFSRGCFKSCTFCVAPKLREVQKGLGCYHRTKAPQTLIREIEHKIDDYDLTMLSFSDTDFLAGVHKPTMGEFLSMYAKRFKLPFTMQTSVSKLLDEDVLELLRKSQCCAVSVGVESGSRRIQKDVLGKVIPEEMIKKAFDLCRKHKIRVTANYMVGLPYETEDDVRKTIQLNRLINPPSVAVTFFTPFIGTKLYDVCIKEGFYQPFEGKNQENVYDYPPLNMPGMSQNKIKSLVEEFVMEFNKYQEDFNIING